MKGRRRSHIRTYKTGTKAHVREHAFSGGAENLEFSLTWKDGEARINGATTYQMRCIHCGQLVYFYRNESGSRVFFDDLGKPWPKHGCAERSRKLQDVSVLKAQPVKRQMVRNPNKKVSNSPDKGKIAPEKASPKTFVSTYRPQTGPSKKVLNQLKAEKLRKQALEANHQKWLAEGKPTNGPEAKFEVIQKRSKLPKGEINR